MGHRDPPALIPGLAATGDCGEEGREGRLALDPRWVLGDIQLSSGDARPCPGVACVVGCRSSSCWYAPSTSCKGRRELQGGKPGPLPAPPIATLGMQPPTHPLCLIPTSRLTLSLHSLRVSSSIVRKMASTSCMPWLDAGNSATLSPLARVSLVLSWQPGKGTAVGKEGGRLRASTVSPALLAPAWGFSKSAGRLK